jgi:hypothetical protein
VPSVGQLLVVSLADVHVQVVGRLDPAVPEALADGLHVHPRCDPYRRRRVADIVQTDGPQACPPDQHGEAAAERLRVEGPTGLVGEHEALVVAVVTIGHLFGQLRPAMLAQQFDDLGGSISDTPSTLSSGRQLGDMRTAPSMIDADEGHS